MSWIKSNSVIHIARECMRAIDPRLAEHGERTAYILYKMLYFNNKHGERKNRVFTTLALLHDVGAYKTDEINQMMRFELEGAYSHAIYGYLYLRHLSPFQEYADIILYHHLPAKNVEMLDIPHKDVLQNLIVADNVELLLRNSHLGESYLDAMRGTTMSPAAVELFTRANKYYKITAHIQDGSYRAELDAFINAIKWDQAIAEGLLEFLVFSLDFRHEYSVLRTASASAIARYLAEKQRLTFLERQRLRNASLIYDLGMLSVPADVLNSTKPLDPPQMQLVQQHIGAMDTILKPYVEDDTFRIARAHHERLDGSGYPEGLRGESLGPSQRILMLADVVAALNTERPDRTAFSRADTLGFLDKEVEMGRLCPSITRIAIEHYDSMMAWVEAETTRFLQSYLDIKEQFGGIMARLYTPKKPAPL